MKRLNLITIALLLLIVAGCSKKQIQPNDAETGPLSSSEQTELNAAAACQPIMWQLVVDPGTGFSFVNRVSGSPTAGPVVVAPYVVSGSNQLIECSGVPIKFASGLSYDPSTNTFWGTTGAAGSPANHILKFTDPNCVSVMPAAPTCGIALDLSDIERMPGTARYYAINRGAVNPNNRVVNIGIPAPNVNCLPNFLSPSLTLRGLTFGCNNQLYVAHAISTSMRIWEINPGTGANVPPSPYPYSGPITPGPGVAVPEMGLHFDCFCIGRFITGNYDPVGPATLMTDGIAPPLGGPFYASLPGVIKPTVDWARVQP